MLSSSDSEIDEEGFAMIDRLIFVPGSFCRSCAVAGLVLLLASGCVRDSPNPGGYLPQEEQTAVSAFGNLPLSFEANEGQTDREVQFIARGSGYNLFLTSSEAVLALSQPASGIAHPGNGATDIGTATDENAGPETAAVLRMQLVGANPEAPVLGIDQLPGKVNYFIGDQKKWKTGVRAYAKVRYRSVYPGIDLLYYGRGRRLEYDFVVAPGVDPAAIRITFDGAEEIALDSGDVVLTTGAGEVRLWRPVAYQGTAETGAAVPARYILRDRSVEFEIGAYDTTRPLIIDPILSYSTYLGGSIGEIGYAITVDALGSAYVTGFTASPDFPTVSGFQETGEGDAFVSKLNSDGTMLVYSTYLGGSSGDGGLGIEVDSTGNAYVTGSTFSDDFPTANPIQAVPHGHSEAFVAKLNPTGNGLVYSTYLGGSNFDAPRGIDVDPAGNAYVAGWTLSPDFPLLNAFQSRTLLRSAFVTKIDPSGSALVYSTFLGDSSEGWGIAVDPMGNAYVTGKAGLTDFPVVNAVQPVHGGGGNDLFVAKFDAAGSALIYATYLGGSGVERYDFFNHGRIAVDPQGNAYVTGYTNSEDFPTSRALQPVMGGAGDAFVVNLNPSGSAFVYSTFLGGSEFDEGLGIEADAEGNAYVAGRTGSADFPVVDAIQAGYGGGFTDGFLTKLNPDGSAMIVSTLLGGNQIDYAWAVAADSSGSAYVTGSTDSSDFPTANVQQSSLGSAEAHAFVSKIAEEAPVTEVPLA